MGIYTHKKWGVRRSRTPFITVVVYLGLQRLTGTFNFYEKYDLLLKLAFLFESSLFYHVFLRKTY